MFFFFKGFLEASLYFNCAKLKNTQKLPNKKAYFFSFQRWWSNFNSYKKT